MKTEIVAAHELTKQDLDGWLRFVNGNPLLGSPFFSSAFTRLVASVRSDVYVARLTANSECVGFFPFQANRNGDGEPVGAGSSDYHGIVSGRNLPIDAVCLIQSAGLSSWRYHHLVDARRAFSMHHEAIRESPTIELRHGFEQYRRTLSRRSRHFLEELERRERRLARDAGVVEFVADVADAELLALTLSWKREQLASTYLPDLEGWEKELLGAIAKTTATEFRGLLSALYAGGHLVASHFGMASASTWHYWYPAFNRAFGRYSPGHLLLYRMIRGARELGLIRIDLGKTTYPYKRSFMNSARLLAEGAVIPP